MKKSILKEQYTIKRFKEQNPNLNRNIKLKLEEEFSDVTLEDVLNVCIKSDPTYSENSNEVGNFQYLLLLLFSNSNGGVIEKYVNSSDNDINQNIYNLYELMKKYKDIFDYKMHRYYKNNKELILDHNEKSKNGTTKKIKKITQDVIRQVVLDQEIKNIKNNTRDLVWFKNEIIQQYGAQKTYKEIEQLKVYQQKASFNELVENNEQIHIYGNNLWDIYMPITKKQQIVLGRGTKWCISYIESTNYFYNAGYQDQPFFILIPKNNLKDNDNWLIKFQLHIKKGYETYWGSNGLQIMYGNIINIFYIFDGLSDAIRNVASGVINNMQKIKNALSDRRDKDVDVPDEYTEMEFIRNVDYISTQDSLFSQFNKISMPVEMVKYVSDKEPIPTLIIERYWYTYNLFILQYHINNNLELNQQILDKIGNLNNKLLIFKYCNFDNIKNNGQIQFIFMPTDISIKIVVDFLNNPNTIITNKEQYFEEFVRKLEPYKYTGELTDLKYLFNNLKNKEIEKEITSRLAKNPKFFAYHRTSEIFKFFTEKYFSGQIYFEENDFNTIATYFFKESSHDYETQIKYLYLIVRYPFQDIVWDNISMSNFIVSCEKYKYTILEYVRNNTFYMSNKFITDFFNVLTTKNINTFFTINIFEVIKFLISLYEFGINYSENILYDFFDNIIKLSGDHKSISDTYLNIIANTLTDLIASTDFKFSFDKVTDIIKKCIEVEQDTSTKRTVLEDFKHGLNTQQRNGLYQYIKNNKQDLFQMLYSEEIQKEQKQYFKKILSI